MAEEKQFENKIKKFLKESGCYYVKQFGCAFTKAGVPDLLVCANGKFIALEVKASNGRPSLLQLENIKDIQAANGVAMVVYPKDFESLKAYIKQTLQQGDACNK